MKRYAGPVALLFKAAVIAPVLLILLVAAYQDVSSFVRWEVLFWAGAVAAIELLPVPAWRGLQLSLGFPVLLGVGFLYTPAVAALIALIGSFDRKELQRAYPLVTALFNRCQIALSVFAGSVVFHAIASVESPLYLLAPAVLLATASDYAVNVSLVALYMRLVNGIPLPQVLSKLRVGPFWEFLLSYLGLGFIGVVIARLYLGVGIWSVAAFILPLIFARQMFFRSMALEQASDELRDRERVLRALSNRMAEERHEERMQIAGYLHDDLAQRLFVLTLQIELAKKRLAQGDLSAAARNLDQISTTKEETYDLVRALIRDLHRSPIGRRGLAEAIDSFAGDLRADGQVRVSVDVADVSLPPPIQLLIYQVAREAVANAVKHGEPSDVSVSLTESQDGVELRVSDDGKGFDPEGPTPEGHFGTVMMRERTLVAGGTFAIESQPGGGTSVIASFPRVWVEEDTTGAEAPTAPETTQGARAPGGSSDDASSQRRAAPDTSRERSKGRLAG